MLQDIAPAKYSPEYKNITPEAEDTVFVFAGKGKRAHRILVGEDMAGELLFPTAAELMAGGAEKDRMTFLFSIDDRNFFLLRQFAEEAKCLQLQGYAYQVLNVLRRCQPQMLCFAGVTAYHLYDWYLNNQFCGCCGSRTEHSGKERALRCPECGNMIFPKICPAVIVGVRNKDKILVSRYAQGAYRGIALLAGFCEIGETVEETVAREVMEEVGIRVKNITYYKSQPWGFASDLLMGFYCDVDGDTTLTIDREELAIAEWVSREELVNNPNNLLALTGEMIDRFKDGLDREKP